MSQESQLRRLPGQGRYRASPRLPGFDYTKPGSYFVTSCTQNRVCLFGEVTGGQLRLNEVGEMVERWWQELSTKFPSIHIGPFVVMPNHVHGIVTIRGAIGADLRVRPYAETISLSSAETISLSSAGVSLPQSEEAFREGSLPTIMQWFKTMTTNEYIRGVHQGGWAPFEGKVWQRSFHDHIIQDQEEWENICRYIARNPLRWAEDEENPNNQTPETKCL